MGSEVEHAIYCLSGAEWASGAISICAPQPASPAVSFLYET